MLGTLAVMGVLSVAGIAGYNVAMKKYRANEMLDKVISYAYRASATIMAGGVLNTNPFKDDFSGCASCEFSAGRACSGMQKINFVQIVGKS